MEHLNPFEMIRILQIDAVLPLRGTMFSFHANRYLRCNFGVQNVCGCVCMRCTYINMQIEFVSFNFPMHLAFVDMILRVCLSVFFKLIFFSSRNISLFLMS